MFIVHAFEQGGIFMYFILIFAVLTVAFIVERFRALYMKTKVAPPDFRKNLLEYIRSNDFAGAERFAGLYASQMSVPRIALNALKIRGRSSGDEELQARMDESLSAELAQVDQRTGFLAMFGNVATLVGLLGTIGGMIVAFAGVADANPADRATMLSKGISHALNCTAFGLLVAIPALVFFAVLQNRTDQVVKAIIAATSEIYHDLLFLTDSGTAKHAGTDMESATDRARRPSNEIRA